MERISTGTTLVSPSLSLSLLSLPVQPHLPLIRSPPFPILFPSCQHIHYETKKMEENILKPEQNRGRRREKKKSKREKRLGRKRGEIFALPLCIFVKASISSGQTNICSGYPNTQPLRRSTNCMQGGNLSVFGLVRLLSRILIALTRKVEALTGTRTHLSALNKTCK